MSVRVLVVDDYEEAAEASCLLFQVLGHEARHARSGAAALEQFETFAPDVLILDIGLPDLDGYQIAREIRVRSRERPVFIAALTGWGAPEDRVRSLAAGIDLHVVKPPTASMVEEILQTAKRRLDGPT